jgi:hypothetical protein
MERKGGLLLVFVVLALSAATTNATVVTIELTGEITEVAFSKWGNTEIRVGDQITGFYTYDTEAYDENPLPTVGRYRYSSPPCGITLTVNGLLFQSDPGNVDFYVKVFNDFPGDPFTTDRFYISSERNEEVSGVPITFISWQLDDRTGTIFTSTSIPSSPPALEAFDWQGLYILGPRGSALLIGRVTSVTQVPEPMTLLFLAAGALAFVRR